MSWPLDWEAGSSEEKTHLVELVSGFSPADFYEG